MFLYQADSNPTFGLSKDMTTVKYPVHNIHHYSHRESQERPCTSVSRNSPLGTSTCNSSVASSYPLAPL